VDSIKREVETLACTWRFTPRVNRLRLALFGGGSFCRSDWNLVFGPPTATVDSDLESYYDWSAVRRLNLIKTRNEKSPLRADRPRNALLHSKTSAFTDQLFEVFTGDQLHHNVIFIATAAIIEHLHDVGM